MSSNADEVLKLKEQGNACLAENKITEAIQHYSQALSLDPQNYIIYSNRSLAHLKIKQYYRAYKDAIETIRLKPIWAKGYFRKAEVEASTFHLVEALISYRCALELQPDTPHISEAINRVSLLLNKEKRANEQVPWLGAGVGIIIGVIIVIADQIFTSSPSISHPIVMAILTIAIAVIGFLLAKAYRYYLDCQRKGLLEPPSEIIGDLPENKDNGNNCSTNGKSGTYQRYSKAQARLKLRKGKT